MYSCLRGQIMVFICFNVRLELCLTLMDCIVDKQEKMKMKNKTKKGIFYKYDLLNAGSAGYPDGWLYTQVALRYRLPYHLFVHGVMKAHLTKVEFVAFGVGAYL